MKINEKRAALLHRLCEIFPGLVIETRRGGWDSCVELVFSLNGFHVLHAVDLKYLDANIANTNDMFERVLRDIAHNLLDGLLGRK